MILWNNFNIFLRWMLPSYLMDWYWNIRNVLPQLIFAVLFIAGGVWLIRGKKREMDEEEDGKDVEQP